MDHSSITDEQEIMALLILDVAILMREEAELLAKRKFAIEINITNNLDEKVTDCHICYESKGEKEFVSYSCRHSCCKDCFKLSLSKVPLHQSPQCAFCRTHLCQIYVANETVYNELVSFIE